MKRPAYLFVLIALAGCVGGKQQITAEDKQRLQAQILEAVPADAKKVDVNFENKVHLVGFKVDPELAPPGTPVKVTYYWRCDDPLEEGWQLFTHIQHEGFEKPDNLDGNGPLRELKGNHQVLGPDRWERGKIYADEQTFTMPQDLRGPDTMVYVGIWKGDARLRILSGPNDGDNRAIVAKIKTGVAPRKEENKRGATDIPSLFPMRLAAGEKITVDGKGDEPVWGAAASTGPFVDVGTGRSAASYPVVGQAKLAWDNDNMYVLIEVKDADIVGYFTDKASQPKDWTVTGQPMTWTKDTAEIMIDPDGDGDNINYYELQINPANKVFKTQFDAYNSPKTDPQGPYGHEDWDPKMKTAVTVKGTIDSHGDKDEGYVVEAAIPWAAFEKGARNHPPKPGDSWRMNFYAMENNGGTAWSPILGQGNFHRASRFGRVIWSTKESLAAADAGAGDAGAGDAGAGRADAGVANDAGARLRPRPAASMPPP
ncbi:MAG TPA: carbohydrate-binding family 9-like protein [Labilithrix sp.]|nr:carbohydrate-binding family 9-like protein [Labilithrix sp.]